MVSQFTDECSEKLMDEQYIIVDKLQRLCPKLCQIEAGLNEEAKNYIRYGVARRIKTLRRCVQNIFEVFPPSTSARLSDEELGNVQINLHAFLINLYGIFDNLALAFIARHKLKIPITQRSCFKGETKKYFLPPIKTYIDQELSGWSKYFTDNRNSLAHRIPMYLPPYTIQPHDKERYEQLTAKRIEYLNKINLEHAKQVQSEVDRMGDPCFWVVTHESDIDKRPNNPFYLHPQILSDCETIAKFCDIFFQYWHEHNKT